MNIRKYKVVLKKKAHLMLQAVFDIPKSEWIKSLENI